jgi:peptidyl-prolyl cis-trans isomerase D
MMMRTMRENTKVILWMVVVAFVVTIFAVWGLDLRTGNPTADPNLIGKVNGLAISRGQYQNFYEMLASQFRAASDTRSLTYEQEEFVAQQAWDNLVLSVLTEQEIEKLGIKVSNEEIVSFLRDSPPAEIRQYFVDEKGNFDNAAYQTALNNPEVDWTNLEQLARERIPRLKLQNYLSSQVYVSEDDVVHSFQTETIEMNIRYVSYLIDTTSVGDYTPTEEDIKTYYDSHQEEFTQPEKARLDLIQIAFEPSAADLDDARYTATRVQEQLVAGEDFAVLASTYSEAPTSHVEGNTGFIKRGQREDGYFDALDALEPGALSEPVAGETGYYVLKLIEKQPVDTEDAEKTEPAIEYNVQEILIKAAPSRQTVDSLFSLAGDLRDRAEGIGLEEAAAEYELELLTPEAFTENSPIGTIGFVPALTRFSFSNEVGTVGPVLRDEKHLYVARVVDRIPETVSPIADVAELIRQMLLREKKDNLTHRSAQAFYQKASIASFEEAVETYQVVVHDAGPLRAVDNLDNFGPNSAVAEAALVVEAGETCKPVEWRGAYVVVHVLDKTEFNQTDFATQSRALKDRIEGQKIQAYIAFWYEKLKSESLVEDYRGKVN